MMTPKQFLTVAGYPTVNWMKLLAKTEDLVFQYGSYCWPLKKCAHKAIAIVLHCLSFKFPENAVLEGEGSIAKVGDFLKSEGVKKPLIMTDKNLVELGQVKKLTDSLEKAGLGYAIYDGVVPDPTVRNVEDGYKVYADNKCDAVIGFGGGSPIDAAKVVAGRAVRPARTTDNMGGMFGVTLPDLEWILRKPAKYPKVMCIPTTSGTGAETTFSAVITNPREGRKYTVNDTSIQPDYCVLDPDLTVTVDPEMTALTGIDALSHCTEAYVGDGHNKKSDALSREGIKLIFDNLDKAVKDPNDMQAREALQKAAHIGGQILISGFTTYVHPFAHKTGAMTHITHGFLIGTFMPHILEWYRPEADERLAELADLIGVGKDLDTAGKAEAYIQAIRDLCAPYGIDGLLPQLAALDKKDFIKSVRTEAFAYPVPKNMKDEDIIHILNEVAGIE